MISKEIMNRLLNRVEAAIVSEGIECMCVEDKEGCEIFYVDTSELLFKK